jgi:uncharacterized protein YdgA (DUF945 family)
LVEQGVKHQINRIPKQYGMTVELTNFHRNWFSSDASILWKWQIPAHLSQNAQGQTVTISPQSFEKEFPIHIFHGPVIFNQGKIFFGIGHADTRIDWPLFNNLPEKKEFSQNSVFPHIDIQMALNFLYQTIWNTSIPAFHLTSIDNQNDLQWQGLTIKNKIKGKALAIKGRINFLGGDLNYKVPKSFVHVENLQSRYYLKHEDNGLITGKFSLTLEQLAMQKFDDQQLKLSHLVMDTKSALEQDLFSTEFQVKLASWQHNAVNLGPFNMDLQISKLNATALSHLQKVMQPEQNASPSFRQRNFWSVLATVPDLLKHGLAIDLKDLHLVMTEGPVDVQAHLELAADTASSFLGMQLIQNLQGNIDFNLAQKVLANFMIDMVEKQLQLMETKPETTTSPADLHQAALTRVESKLSELVKSGVFIKDNANYLIHLKINKGELSLNNKPFDSSWLLI